MLETDAGRRFVVCALNARAAPESLVEQHGELVRDLILDRLRRRDDGADTGLAQRIDVRLRRACVEHDELQAALASEERRKSARIRDRRRAIRLLEEQPFGPGMPREVQHGDPVTIRVVLERLHDLLGRRVGEDDDLANATALRIVERGDNVAKLER